MKLLTIIAALALAAQVQAAPVECVPLGTVYTMRSLEAGRQLLRTELTVGPTAIGSAVYYYNSGQAVGGGTIRQAMTVAPYFRCTLPGGGTLGAGTATWAHRNNSAKVQPGTENANRVVVSRVDIGAGLDGADNAATGTVLGASASWPNGEFGTPVSVPVHFAGAAVGDTFDVRLSSEVQAGEVSWSENMQSFALDVEVSPAVESEADRLIDQLAAILGIDAETLRQLLSALAVPQ